ncbi:MAG: sugar phosphate isomerase/epimerase [Pseudomonadota bacterium]
MTLSYQLYSSRAFPPLRQTLRMLADIGYSQVEGYGALLADDATVRDLELGLQETGLTMPSCHVALEMCSDAPETVARLSKRLGIDTVVIPFLPPEARPGDRDGWDAFGRRMAGVTGAMAGYGLRLAYHNHDFEFAVLGSGERPIDIILAAAPDLLFEYDVAWAVRAQADPFDAIRKHGARIALAHVKDIAPPGEKVDEDGWSDPGDGIMDWPGLYGALKTAGTQGFVVEHDNPGDHQRFAQRAFDWVRAQ